MKRLLPYLLLFVIASSCRDNDARIALKLVDRAGQIEAMNLQITGAEVLINGQWQFLNVVPTTYKVTNLINGRDSLIVSQTVPQGELDSIRLVLGTANSLEIQDSTIQIFLLNPSAQSPVIDLKVNQKVEEGSTLSIIVDFDVAQSIFVDPLGRYNLDPVFRVYPEGGELTLSGRVQPLDARPIIYALRRNGDTIVDTLTSTHTDKDGFFKLRGMEEGSYRITYEPVPGYDEFILDDVMVSSEGSGELSDVVLEEDS
jgi:(2Fe-2S) ferredoxin